MTNNITEAAKILRAALKSELGASSRAVSVKASSSAWSEALDVTIRDPRFARHAVERIASRFAHVDKCKTTGEILSGGNRYVNVHSPLTHDPVVVARVVEKLTTSPQNVKVRVLGVAVIIRDHNNVEFPEADARYTFDRDLDTTARRILAMVATGHPAALQSWAMVELDAMVDDGIGADSVAHLTALAMHHAHAQQTTTTTTTTLSTGSNQ